MALIDGMLQELEQEAQTTRRVLERVPDDQLAWRPHPKARTLGELALHVAMVPGGVAELVASPSPAQAPQFTDPSPTSASELHSGARPEHREGKEGARRHGRCRDHGDVAADAGRSGAVRGSAGGDTAVDHAQPLVSPSRPADGVPA